MSILVESTLLANSDNIITIKDQATLVATTGIAIGDDCSVDIKTETDGWSPSGVVLTSTNPSANILGPLTIRVNKPVSSIAFAIEVIRDIPADL